MQLSRTLHPFIIVMKAIMGPCARVLYNKCSVLSYVQCCHTNTYSPHSRYEWLFSPSVSAALGFYKLQQDIFKPLNHEEKILWLSSSHKYLFSKSFRFSLLLFRLFFLKRLQALSLCVFCLFLLIARYCAEMKRF